MSSWTIQEPEVITSYIPTIDKITKKKTSIPVTRTYLVLKHSSGDEWRIGLNPNGKFTLKYPESIRPIEECGAFKTRIGFHRSGEKKVIENKDTGMAGETLARKLIEKFGAKFARKIVVKLQQSQNQSV